MKCFYHSADLDGHCSGAIVKMMYPECEMIGINYGQPFPWNRIEMGETVFMVDFCLQPFDDMERLNSLCCLNWIDHHAKGSIDEARARNFHAKGGQFIEVGRAACELVWDFFFQPKNPPLAVYLLGRYDVWKHEENAAILPFQYGMRQFSDTYPENQELWQRLFNEPDFCAGIVKDGVVLLNYENSQNSKFCKAYAFETTMPTEPCYYPFNPPLGLAAICANRGFTNSKIFDSVYDPEQHDLMITFCRLKPPAGKWTVSLYSTRDDVDCGEIAKAFGGGGHKGAAGFQCEELPFSI